MFAGKYFKIKFQILNPKSPNMSKKWYKKLGKWSKNQENVKKMPIKMNIEFVTIRASYDELSGKQCKAHNEIPALIIIII